jgi:predicted DNA-binding protein YlxM (UPF0122 family)
MKKIKIKLNKNPYRGILTEIATEQGVSPQAVWNAIYRDRNPRILTILAQKISERKQIIRKIKREMEVCS